MKLIKNRTYNVKSKYRIGNGRKQYNMPFAINAKIKEVIYYEEKTG